MDNIRKRIEELEAEIKKLEVMYQFQREENQKEGLEQLANISEKIFTLIKEGEEVSEKYGVHWFLEGMPYGMGGSYEPKTGMSSYREEGWLASSHSC